ncbi:MAG: DUF1194 domain-containing protein [Rhizobiales bacterium]|nr:DUF1194 domain-containing protein [Hyphomicrobiales bacterium]MBI3673394.1 DUF1194 domain-containing protein [Hyphomicrobiales bacterium]
MFRPALLPYLLPAVLGLAAVPPADAADASVDLLLVLAVDASGSVDDGEFALQLGGIAQAFRDATVKAAIAAGPQGRIAVDLEIWADHQVPKDSSGWFVIAAPLDAEAFAARVETTPRTQNGATGIGEGIAAGLRLIAESGFEAPRRVIDVSGDGRETPAREYVVLLPQARAMAYERGVTVNGLAIVNEEPDLLAYYDTAVRTGPGSFAMATPDYRSFAEAMRRKLLREIEDRPKLSSR